MTEFSLFIYKILVTKGWNTLHDFQNMNITLNHSGSYTTRVTKPHRET